MPQGELVVARSYAERRHLLLDLGPTGRAWCTTTAFTGDLGDVYAAADQLGLEGDVAKRLDGRYHCAKRSRTWVKIKSATWRDVHGVRRHEQA